MHCAPPARDREIWSWTITYLILGCICYAAPLSAFATPHDAAPANSSSVMHIQGGNSPGARLAPALRGGYPGACLTDT